MAELYKNGFDQVNQGTLQGLAKTGGRSLLAKKDKKTSINKMKSLGIKDTAEEQGIVRKPLEKKSSIFKKAFVLI